MQVTQTAAGFVVDIRVSMTVPVTIKHEKGQMLSVLSQ